MNTLNRLNKKPTDARSEIIPDATGNLAGTISDLIDIGTQRKNHKNRQVTAVAYMHGLAQFPLTYVDSIILPVLCRRSNTAVSGLKKREVKINFVNERTIICHKPTLKTCSC